MSSQAYKETGKRRLTGNGEEDTALIPASACVAPEELWERLPRGQGECVQAMELVRGGCQSVAFFCFLALCCSLCDSWARAGRWHTVCAAETNPWVTAVARTRFDIVYDSGAMGIL